ncbi:MAG: DUF3524 domain-containing protein [Phycisphaerales bacterium]
MNIAYIDAYHAGSHAAFSRGWSERSRHSFAFVTHPGSHWRWRMRHAGVTGARAIADMHPSPDAIVATGMCPVAELRGHLPARLRAVPLILYMHEHQFDYPTPNRSDAHAVDNAHEAMTNILGTLAADAVWWNSRYTLDTFLAGARSLLRRMPPPRMLERLDEIVPKSSVLPPGVDDALFELSRSRGATPRLLWNARWEYDKGADIVAEALTRCARRGVDFSVDLVGPTTAPTPEMLALRDALGGRTNRFGHQPARDYRRSLAEADLVISGARHEFFGIGVVEAVAAGAAPIVPRTLAYPEVLEDVSVLWHDGTAGGLASTIERACAGLSTRGDAGNTGRDALRRLAWSTRAHELDSALEAHTA